MLTTPNAWYVREQKLDNGMWAVACHLSDDHPDGAVVDAPSEAETSPVLWRTRPVDRGIIGVELAPFAAPSAPPVWFVNVDEPRASPAATNLVGFASDHFPPGTIISNYTFASLPVVSEDQAAALRWYPRTGVVHQVYVSQRWRRLQLGTAVIYAASAFHQANGWPDRLHSDGRRTDIGEQFVAGLRHPARIAPRDAVMPPMDPA